MLAGEVLDVYELAVPLLFRQLIEEAGELLVALQIGGDAHGGVSSLHPRADCPLELL
jgi:hypothetical protein